MVWQKPEGMDKYLQATKLCDCDNVRLKDKAAEIINGAEAPKEAALKIFYFVRDDIAFGMNYADEKASGTLKKGVGFCISKTNVQIALLRAVGIPARCHYALVPKERNRPIIPGFMYDRMPMALAHSWCECYLSEQWIACEALLDKAFYTGCLGTGVFTKDEMPTIDWDGETDLILSKPWILEAVGTFPSWDDAMMEVGKRGEAMPPSNKLFGWLIFSIINRRINYIRKP